MMSKDDVVTIWGGVPRFGTTPTTGQAIAGKDNGFVIYDSAEDNTGIVPISQTPLPNKNMELAQKTVAGVTTKYYGFAGYCGAYYSTITQLNLAYENIVSFDDSQVQYETNVLGTPKTKITALFPGVYRISGTLDFYVDESGGSFSVVISLSGTAPVSSVSAPVSSVSAPVSSASGTGASQTITLSGDPETITVNGQTITISGQTASVSGQTASVSGQTANLSGVSTTANISWSDIALTRYINVWLKKNGVLVPWTSRDYKTFGDFARLVVNVDYLINLGKDEYVELAWAGSDISGVLDPNIKLVSIASNFPSALINMTLVR